MKIATWNVNSINARIQHLVKFIEQDKSDIYLIQELKCVNENFPFEQIKKLKYFSYVNCQKAWNGVAIISNKESSILQNQGEENLENVGIRVRKNCKTEGNQSK